MPASPTDRDRETAARLSPCGEPVTCAEFNAQYPDTPTLCDECQRADAITAALADARAEGAADARREEREADCKAMCLLCRGEESTIHPTPVKDGAAAWDWWHPAVRGPSLPCRAAAIRARGEGEG